MNPTIDIEDYNLITKIVNRIARHTELPDVVGPMDTNAKCAILENIHPSAQGVFSDWRFIDYLPTFPSSADLGTVVLVIRYLLALGVSVEDICTIVLTAKYIPTDSLDEDLNVFRNTVRKHMNTYQVNTGSMEPYFSDSSLHKDRITAMKGLLDVFCQSFDLHKSKPLYKRTLTYDIRKATTHYEHHLINDPRLDNFCEKIVKSKIKNPYKVNTLYKKYYTQLQNFKFKHTLTSGYISNPRLKEENRQELQRILVKIFEATIVGIKSFGTSYKKLREEHIYYSERYSYKTYEDMSVAELLLELMRVNTYQLEDYLKRLFIIVTLGEKLGFDLIDWYLGYNVEMKTIEEEGWIL